VEPLIINAEGGTTNGKYLIQFKKGAFVGLKSIQPRVIKYNYLAQSPSSGVLEGLPHYLIGACSPPTIVSRVELPVFRPNEFFFQHHQREGEERWETYCRTIRQLISEHGNLPLSDLRIEDKFEYKQMLFPKNAKKTA